MIRRSSLLLFALALAPSACAPAPPARPVASAPTKPAPVAVTSASLDGLESGAQVQGFVARAVYMDDDGRARGARLVHARTGFTFDYLQVESAPQAMLYVTTYPTSDDGEPHTQEHLLLGKGNKGRYLGNFEHVMLSESNAFTEQYRTVYDFYTTAGEGAFWPLLRTELDTLLHPDYTDDEIRREVRDYGVSKDEGGELSIAEQGTVYNEMVRTSESPDALLWWGANKLLYGDGHPLALVSGGTPEGIRKLTPADIRKFHAEHYALGNMGMVGAFSATLPLGAVLTRVGETLDGLAAPSGPESRHFMSATDLPPPAGASAGTARVLEYPYATTEHPSPMALAWPASRHLELSERTLLKAFLGAFGEGEGSTLYRVLVDQKTRLLDVGATGVSSWVEPEPGQPVFVWVENVAPAHSDAASLASVRALVKAQLAAIAALPDGSAELAAFGERVKARVIASRRSVDKFLDTPPQFGARGTHDDWLRLLDDVNEAQTFRRSLTKRAAFEHALDVAGAAKNPWRERIAAWGLLEEPYGLQGRASPGERARLDDERKARTQGELARWTSSYGVTDAKEALRRRAAEIAHVTEELDRAEANVPMPPFWSEPPMTKDDLLSWRADAVRGVPVVASTFETMKSVTVGLALRLDAVPEDALPYAAMLPGLLSDVGVVRGGAPISYEDVRDRLRREVLEVQVRFDVSSSKDRAELLFVASGNDVDEAKRALGWVKDFLTSPDWRPENLARLRDVMTAKAAALDDVTTGSEEGWAMRLEEAYRRQNSPMLLHAASFLTRAHDAHRLWWMLQDAGAADVKRASALLRQLAGAGKKADRAGLRALAAELAADGAGAASGKKDKGSASAALAPYVTAARGLPAPARLLAKRAGADLGLLVGAAPDASLGADWAEACTQMAVDLEHPASSTLSALARTIAAVRHTSAARAWIVGSTRNQAAVRDDLDGLVATLDPAPVARASYAAGDRVAARARARGAATPAGATIAFINPSTGSGTIANSAPAADLDASGDAIVDSLAAGVFASSGAQSLFKRIWASGLAYNGGIGQNFDAGRFHYYSDRIADPPQLVRVLSDHVRQTPADSRFVDYAVANAFDARVGEEYESRAAGVASDLADGITSDRVRAFRERLLALRKSPRLIDAMHARFVPVLGELLPPLGGASASPQGALHFTIGPEPVIAAYESALRGLGGAGGTVVRIYPRDFWYTGPIAR